jgi:hypothetical protein
MGLEEELPPVEPLPEGVAGSLALPTKEVEIKNPEIPLVKPIPDEIIAEEKEKMKP